MANGRDDILAEAAGITAGSWHAHPAGHVGTELLVAGMLITAGGGNGTPLDYRELERWTRVGNERGCGHVTGNGDVTVRQDACCAGKETEPGSLWGSVRWLWAGQSPRACPPRISCSTAPCLGLRCCRSGEGERPCLVVLMQLIGTFLWCA
jgi:hypothetical protein